MKDQLQRFYDKYTPFLQVLLMVVVVMAVQKILFRIFEMPLQPSFYSDGLVFTHFSELGWKTITGLIGVFITVIFLSIYRPVRLKEVGLLSRWLLITIIVIQTYALTFIDYNYYHGVWFFIDRLILLGLGIYCFFNPYIIPVYLFQLVLLIGQLQFPDIIGYDLTHKSLILPVLLSFWSFLVLNKLVKNRFNWHLFIVIFFSIIGSWYLQAGIAKIDMSWYADNNLYNLMAASVDAGWLHFLDSSLLQELAAFVDRYHVALQYGGVIVEILFPLLLLVNRRLSILCFIGFISFHLLVYLVSGIFFWQWIVMEIVIIAGLIYQKSHVQPLFKKQYLLTYLILLLLQPLFINVTTLAWFDCGFINSYTFFLINDDHEEKRLDSSFFAPYDVGIAKNRFTYTNKSSVISGTLGSCNDRTVIDITDAWNKNKREANLKVIRNYKEQKGRNNFNELHTQRFFNFLTTFVENKIQYDPPLIGRIDAPLHMQQGQNQQSMNFSDAREIKVLYQEKVVLPNLRFDIIKKDSFLIDLSKRQSKMDETL